MENSIEFFLNTHLEWSLSHQDLVITLKPRAQLCMEITSDRGDYWSRVEMVIRVRMSKVQGRQCSRCGIKF